MKAGWKEEGWDRERWRTKERRMKEMGRGFSGRKTKRVAVGLVKAGAEPGEVTAPLISENKIKIMSIFPPKLNFPVRVLEPRDCWAKGGKVTKRMQRQSTGERPNREGRRRMRARCGTSGWPMKTVKKKSPVNGGAPSTATAHRYKTIGSLGRREEEDRPTGACISSCTWPASNMEENKCRFKLKQECHI